MKRPLTYIKAFWGVDPTKNTEIAAKYSKQIEKRMVEIIEMQNHIINYSKTKDIFLVYKESGYSTKYYKEYAGDILIHRSAKNAFNDLRGRKISSIQDLKSEYATLVDKKRIAHQIY